MCRTTKVGTSGFVAYRGVGFGFSVVCFVDIVLDWRMVCTGLGGFGGSVGGSGGYAILSCLLCLGSLDRRNMIL